ncbi:hypothetical protein MKW92_009533 [Papaver armeniacum]|nr:hypothetical protein MKW92_009533 [Papaver armeniacum]
MSFGCLFKSFILILSKSYQWVSSYMLSFQSLSLEDFQKFAYRCNMVQSRANSSMVFKMIEPFKFSEPTQAPIANGLAGMTSSLFSHAVLYSGGLDVARKLVKADGIRGLYRGFGLSVMTYSPFSAVWWASYGSIQRVIWRSLGYGTEQNKALVPDPWTVVPVQASGGIMAGSVASCITTPLNTIKTRLQVLGHEKRETAGQVVIAPCMHDVYIYLFYSKNFGTLTCEVEPFDLGQ